MDWVALGLVPFAVLYLAVCGFYVWRSRLKRRYYDPWKHSRPTRKEKQK
jgi:hypothetical protein